MSRTLPTRRVPRKVDLTRGAGLRAARRSAHPLIGLAAGNRPVRLAPQDGHLLLVAPAGMGTSTVLRSLGVQYLAGGGHLDILDAHLVGQAWARGLDRVSYLDEPRAIAAHLHGLAHQARRRAEDGRPGPRRLVMVEALTAEVLLDHHLDARPNGTSMDALTAVLAHGRQAGMQVVLAGRQEIPQPLRHIAADLFTTRLLIEPSADTWLQAGGTATTHPQPDGCHPGRWHHLSAAGGRQLRAARLEETRAAAWATGPSRRLPAPRTTKESER